MPTVSNVRPVPTRPARSWAVAATLVAAVALLLGGCGDDDAGEDTGAGAPTTTAATETTSDETTSDEATTTTPAATSAPTETETTAPPATEAAPTLAPGDPCSLEEGPPDCIDPDGDGEGTYLTGGAACAATAPDIIACEDIDGDGVAGGTDEYADLPTCSAEVAPPCNNPPGSGEDGAEGPDA